MVTSGSNSRITGNQFAQVSGQSTPGGAGGGVYSNFGAITMDGATVSGNTATTDGGGIWNGGTLLLRNTTVTQNKALGQGGGIFNRNPNAFTQSNSTVTGNTPDNIAP